MAMVGAEDEVLLVVIIVLVVGGCRSDPAMQVSVMESGSISTDFAFDNPQYTPSERDALRDRTLTKIKTKSPSADSCEGDIVSRVMQEISTDTSTTSSFVFGATIAGNDDHSGGAVF